MNKNATYFILLLLSLFLVACGGEAESFALSAESSANDTAAESFSADRLNEDYENAASVQTQLAIGTLRLEATELAVDAALANEILPLWQALQGTRAE